MKNKIQDLIEQCQSVPDLLDTYLNRDLILLTIPDYKIPSNETDAKTVSYPENPIQHLVDVLFDVFKRTVSMSDSLIGCHTISGDPVDKWVAWDSEDNLSSEPTLSNINQLLFLYSQLTKNFDSLTCSLRGWLYSDGENIGSIDFSSLEDARTLEDALSNGKQVFDGLIKVLSH